MLQNGLQNFDSDTTRTRIHTSAGGTGVRIRLSNIFGTQMMVVDSANVALPNTSNANDPTAIDTTSLHQVTFNNGETFAEVPPGEELLSDPVPMNVPKLSDLMVTMHFNGLAQYADGHSDSVTPLAGLYVVRGQNVATSASFSNLSFETFNGTFSLSEVEVQVPAQTRVVIAMSESITDGRGAVGIEHPWPAVMASLANAGSDTVAVGNAGIGGNSLFNSTAAGPGCCGVDLLDRFQRDVLSRNPTDIVILAGDNDLGGHSADDIIARYQILIEQAHAQHIKVYGGVNTPIGDIVGTNGQPVSTGFYTPANEAERQQLNAWIQAAGHYDGVIDFSAVVGNPSITPLGIATACYDPESPIHMNNQGYAAMGTVAYDVIFGKTVQPAAPCNSLPFPPAI
ncbi:GDSL-type esterase/lipase family protein [Paraburkholderia humisilvae]|nr:GDSL-type esterase/lipase family protein [Paraburkholderia humisilvae]